MIWLLVSIAVGCLLAISIDHQYPGKHNNAVLFTVVLLWPVLIVALLFTPKEKIDKWQQ